MSEYDHMHEWEQVGELILCASCGRSFGDTSKCAHNRTKINLPGDEECIDCGEINTIDAEVQS